MAASRTCAKCGAILSAESALDVCPRCVAAQVLSPQTVPDGTDASASPAGTVLLELGSLEQPGDRIGRYKLFQKIGEGGCGVVYMAEQEEPVRRRVALKVIKLGMDTKSVIARFEAERQALAMMDHPNIAKVLDAGATDQGRPYFVMELVRGIKVTDYCDQNNLPTAVRLDLFTKVCSAIQHAHQKGIIHRDIKPSNILVTLHDGVPVPKVIDFGIAKATTDQRLTDKTLFTAFEQFIGTPAYMSPEQAEMSGLDIDTRTDIYALGVLLYELLTGKTPFDPRELMAAGIDEMRRTIREKEPARPSTRLSTMLAGELTATAQHRHIEAPRLVYLLRGDLDWIVMKALEKDRTRRYETANGLAMDLQRHLNNEPVVARPPSAAYRFQKMVRRNKLAFTAASAVIVALIIGLGISTWMFFKENQARQRAVAAETKATSESSKSRQVAQFLGEMLNGVGPSVALGQDTKMLQGILDRTAERVGKDLKDQPDVEAELRTTIGQVYFALGAFDKAAEMHRAALALRQKVFGEEHLDTASSLNHLGVALNYETKFPESETLLQKALALRRKLLRNEHPDVAASIHNLGHVFSDQGKYAEAEPLYVEALALRRKLLGNEHLEVAQSLVQLALVRRRKGHFAEAEMMQHEALTMRRKLLGNEHPEVAHSLTHLSGLLTEVGKLAEAEAALIEALAIGRKVMGEEHPALSNWLDRLRGVLEWQGKLAEAENEYRETLARQRKLLGNEHSAVAATLTGLSKLLAYQDKLPEAETTAREAVTLLKELVRKNPGRRDLPQNLGHSLWQLAIALNATQRGGLAEPAAREALQVFEKAARDFPGYRFFRQEQAYSHRVLGRVVSDLGRVEEAQQHYREAIDLYAALRREVPSEVLYWREEAFSSWKLATILESAGRFDTATAEYRRAVAFYEKAIDAFPTEADFKSMLGLARVGLASMLQQQGKLVEADPLYREAWQILQTAGVKELANANSAFYALAEFLFRERPADLDRLFSETLKQATNNPAQTVSLLHSRGDFRARAGRWSDAADDFRKAIELQPDVHEHYHKLAPALFQSGDIEGYLRLRSEILTRFADAKDPPVAERMAKDSLILPLTGTDLANVARMAETAVTVGAGHPFESWFKHAKSLAEYRQQHFADAVKLAQTDGQAERQVQAYAVLAMAHHHLRQTNEAGAALTNAMKIAETRLPNPERGDLGGLWNDWVIARALFREAKALIEPQSK